MGPNTPRARPTARPGATLHLDIDPKTHPAWTGGGQHIVDRGGRVSRFKTRYKGLMSGDGSTGSK